MGLPKIGSRQRGRRSAGRARSRTPGVLRRLLERSLREEYNAHTGNVTLDISPSTINELVRTAQFREFESGATVVAAGKDQRLTLFYLFEKTLRAPDAKAGGEETPLMLVPHQFIGWSAVAAATDSTSGVPLHRRACIRQSTVRTNYPCTIAWWDVTKLSREALAILDTVSKYWIRKMARGATPPEEDDTRQIEVVTPRW